MDNMWKRRSLGHAKKEPRSTWSVWLRNAIKVRRVKADNVSTTDGVLTFYRTIDGSPRIVVCFSPGYWIEFWEKI